MGGEGGDRGEGGCAEGEAGLGEGVGEGGGEEVGGGGVEGCGEGGGALEGGGGCVAAAGEGCLDGVGEGGVAVCGGEAGDGAVEGVVLDVEDADGAEEEESDAAGGIAADDLRVWRRRIRWWRAGEVHGGREDEREGVGDASGGGSILAVVIGEPVRLPAGVCAGAEIA